MAEQAPQSNHIYQLIKHDPDSALVDQMFISAEVPSQSSAINRQAWEKLKEDYPNIRRYIETTCHTIAPQDIELRGKATRSMIGLLLLLEQAKQVEYLEEQFGIEIKDLE